MSMMKELFLKRELLIEKALKRFYNDLEYYKIKSDAIYNIEKLIDNLQKENILLIEYSLEKYLTLMDYIQGYKAIDTLLENFDNLQANKRWLDVGRLRLTQKLYFQEIVKILNIENRVNYIEISIENWKCEYKEFTKEDINNLVEYAMETIEED